MNRLEFLAAEGFTEDLVDQTILELELLERIGLQVHPKEMKRRMESIKQSIVNGGSDGTRPSAHSRRV